MINSSDTLRRGPGPALQSNTFPKSTSLWLLELEPLIYRAFRRCVAVHGTKRYGRNGRARYEAQSRGSSLHLWLENSGLPDKTLLADDQSPTNASCFSRKESLANAVTRIHERGGVNTESHTPNAVPTNQEPSHMQVSRLGNARQLGSCCLTASYINVLLHIQS